MGHACPVLSANNLQVPNLKVKKHAEKKENWSEHFFLRAGVTSVPIFRLGLGLCSCRWMAA